MQSLLVLTAVIAILATYLESVTPGSHDRTLSPTVAKVIRSSNPTSEPAPVASIARETSPSILPLNLRLPTLQDLQWRIQDAQGTNPNLFQKTTEDEDISYSAELVFDAEKGEDITGGRLNIKIPLS